MSNLLQLRTRVRQYLDEEIPSYWKDAELNEWINQAYYYYYIWIGETFDGYFAKDIMIDIVANQAKYQLPNDFWKIRLLERIYTNITIPLKVFDRMETSNITANANTSNAYVPTYRFEGNFFVLEPTPDSGVLNGLRFEYLPTPVRLSLDTDVLAVDYREFWEEPIVLRATLSAKQKEEATGNTGTDMGPLSQMLQTWEQNIKESAEQRTEQRRYTEGFGLDDGYGYGYY